jgi:DNA-binding FadR family transcriptional regulator
MHTSRRADTALDVSDGHHRAIFAAIAARDAEAARAAMWRHMAHIREYIQCLETASGMAAIERQSDDIVR